MSHTCHTPFSAKHWGSADVRYRKSRICSSRCAEPKGSQQAYRSLVNKVELLALLANQSWYDGMLVACCRIITTSPLRIHAFEGRSPVIQQTTKARVKLPRQIYAWDQSQPVGMRLSDFRALLIANNVIRVVLHPDPARRLTAEQVLSHTHPMSLAAPTEYDLCGPREDFDPRDRRDVGNVTLCGK